MIKADLSRLFLNQRMTNSPVRVYIVDDHQMLIDGIKALLANDVRFEIVGESLKCSRALDDIKQQHIDVLITDINMPEMDGITFTKRVKALKPDQKLLALSMYGEKSMVVDMIDAGVSGYILKNTGREELITALLQVAQGKTFYSVEVAETLSKPSDDTDKKNWLTSREREIVKYIAKGLSHTEIGEQLFISPRTVDTHRTNIMRKLNVNSIAELIKVAIQYHIIE